MLRVQWLGKAGSFGAKGETIPKSDGFKYEIHTSSRFALIGTVSTGEFKGEPLRVEFSGDHFKYDIKSNGNLTWTDGNVSSWQFFVHGSSFLTIRFDPLTSSEDVFASFSYRWDRGVEYLGNRYDNHLEGGRGADRIYGLQGDDTILGNAGRDSLYGGAGQDTLDGGAGADRMEGGSGSDTYYVQDKHDVIVEERRGGLDTVVVASNFLLSDPFLENLKLTGSRDLNGIGNNLDNILRGNGGDNLLSGRDGDDSLYGGDGNDRLYGGKGSDYLSGGGGSDLFVFTQERGRYFRAEISAVTSGADRIDLSRIDADTHHAGDQAFSIGSGREFSGVAGELLFGTSRIYGDVDGDSEADFSIHIGRESHLVAADFIL